MTRIPATKARRRMATRAKGEAVFNASPGTRLLAGGMCAVLAVMLVIHQTQIEGVGALSRVLSGLGTIFFGILGWYFWKRGSRKGPVIRVGPDGFGMALGFDTWREFTWDQVQAFRYWEPTGLALLIKRRQSRWVGILLRQKLSAAGLPWDARLEIWLNTFHDRPGLCLLHPFVDTPILDVLQAFKDHAPKALDDYEWMKR